MYNNSSEKLFKNMLDAGLVDIEGVHHPLSFGWHGQKVDFDKIPDESVLFQEVVDLTADRINRKYKSFGNIALLSVANGTNRFVEPIAEVAGELTPLLTEKTPDLKLTTNAEEVICSNEFSMVLVLEDVGTTANNSSVVARKARLAGAKHVEVLNILRRSPSLPQLTAWGIPYDQVIYHPMPSFTPDECSKVGFCAQGWELIN